MIEYKGTTKPQTITPSAAQAILEHQIYEHQRTYRMTDVQKYALAMHRNEWLPGSLLTFCVWQKRRYLVNGQHRLHAVILVGQPVIFEVQEIVVDAYEEIAQWYRVFDRLRVRTLSELYQPFHLPEKHNTNKTQNTHLMACLTPLAAGFEAVSRSDNQVRIYTESPLIRMAFLEHWLDEGRRYYEDTRGARQKITTNLRRTGIMAVALVTYRFTGNDAEEFWHQVAMDDGLRVDDPRKRLHIFLGSTQSGEYPPHMLARYAAAAWNAAWEERTLQSLNPQLERLPVRLEGTPHVGKQVLRYITPQGEMSHDPIPYEAGQWQQDLFAARSQQVNLKVQATGKSKGSERKGMWETTGMARQYYNSYQRTRYAQLKSAGVCPHCGKRPPYDTMVSCLHCRGKQRRYNRLFRMRQRELRRQGIQELRCHCHKRADILCIACQAPLCDTCYDLGEGKCRTCVDVALQEVG